MPGYVFPNFPPKTWFKSFDLAFLEQRRVRLQYFLACAVTFAQEHNLQMVFDFLEFTKLAALR